MVNAYLGIAENSSRRFYPGQPITFVWGLSLGDITEDDLVIDLGTARAEITSDETGGTPIVSRTQDNYVIEYRLEWPSQGEFREPHVISRVPQAHTNTKFYIA